MAPMKVKSFDLKDVRLLPSRFRENMMRDSMWMASIEVNRLFLTTFYSYPDGDLYFSFFYATIVSGSLNMKVHRALKWVLPCELENHNFCPADTTVIRRLASLG